MASIQLLLISCFTIFHATFALAPRCTINVKTGLDQKNPPMLLTATKSPNYIYPNIQNPQEIVLGKGEKMVVACPGQTNPKSTGVLAPGVLLVKKKPIKSDSEKLECAANGQLTLKGKPVVLTDVACEEKPRASYGAILRPTKETCDRGQKFEIGYDLGALGFVKTIELCHDAAKAKTLWSRAIIQPIDQEFARYSGHDSSGFKAGNLYSGVSLSKKEPYSLQVEYNTLKAILGPKAKVDNYISPKPSARKFLAKGHLIANADKFYKSEQESTYFYANVVPMWQAINANPGNWFFVEEYVRLLAYKSKRELEVYVGGLGTLKIEGKDFSLLKDGKIPVPKVLFKCVADVAVKEGLCFVVANNPYVAEANATEYLVCKKNDKCDTLTSHAKDAKLGYLYCCNIGDFYQAAKAELGLNQLEPMKSFKEIASLPVSTSSPSKAAKKAKG